MARPGHYMDPFPWSLGRIAAQAAKGDLSPQTVTAAAADAIRVREPSVRAWSALALEPARKRAKSLTKELGAQGPRSPLHGVPYGAKDIFDSAGIPTEWGSATQRGRIPGRDCDLVRRLESLGCVLVGKTETTAFAYYDTGPTRNPRDLARTPGGSSSGSAAAVAAGMVPLAFGTQTQGSVLRPASFCGIAGFKPTFGLLPLGGVMAFAPTLDHAGIFAATAADIDVTWRSLGFKSRGVPASAITVLDWPPGGSLEATMQNAFRSAVRALGEMGVGVESVERPAFFDLLPDALHTVMAYECAREHAERYRQHGRDGAGRHYLPSFPGSKERIADYDVIFLGDVGEAPDQLKESDLELIRGLVEQQAGGLVLLPGRGGFQKTLLNGPLADLIPVVLDQQKPEGIALQNESRLALSAAGRGHWLTRFDAESQKNNELWRQLPGFYWSAAVEKSRPGSEVLAVHSAMRNSWGRIPLLVTRFFGNGKVLFMGTDSAWRWRRGVEDKYHYRFWSQIVRWMAHQRHLSKSEGIRLNWTPEAAEVGDKIHLHASVADPSGYPAQSGRVLAYVDSPSGRSEKIEFAPLKGGWGVFAAVFQPQETGKHQITIQAEEHGRQLRTILPVTRPLLEKIGQPVNRRALREIASISRGQLAGAEELDAVVSALQSMPEPALREIRLRLWANPWWGGFLLSLLALYWGGRKLIGLV